MKHLLVSIFLIAFSFSLFGQSPSLSHEEEHLIAPANKENEVKINLLYSLWGYTELNYERLFKNRTSLGFSMGATLFDRDGDYVNFTFNPQHRIYFGKKNCSGFFFETSAAYINVTDSYYRRSEPEKIGIFGLGFAIGAKYVRDTGLVAEVVGGVGRAFEEDNDYFGGVYPRFGIQIGQRF